MRVGLVLGALATGCTCAESPPPAPGPLPVPACTADQAPPPCATWVPEVGLWASRTEVSAADQRACATRGDCAPAGADTPDDAPAVLSWQDADALCRGLGGRLPTAHEWRALASGPDGAAFPWGHRPRCLPEDPAIAQRVRQAIDRTLRVCEALLADVEAGRDGLVAPEHPLVAMCRDPQAHRPAEVVDAAREALGEAPIAPTACHQDGPQPVGRHDTADHPLGLLWTAGNVWEWTSTREDGRPTYRGGSWMSLDPEELSRDALGSAPEDLVLPDVGARCVFDAEAP